MVSFSACKGAGNIALCGVQNQEKFVPGWQEEINGLQEKCHD